MNEPSAARTDRPRLFLSRRIDANAERELCRDFDVSLGLRDQPTPRQQLLEALEDAHGVLIGKYDRLDCDALAVTRNLEIIVSYGAGVDHVDTAAAARRGVRVATTADMGVESVAQLTLGLLLALLRRIVEGDRSLRVGDPRVWEIDGFLGSEPQGRHLLVVGDGRIGRRVAELGRVIGMTTAAADRNSDLRALLSEADVVSLHCPLTPETHHLIGAKELAAMRRTSFLINASRGAVVDSDALVAALVDEAIAGAALDVHEGEPHVDERLLGLSNVVLTPHIGNATRETRAEIAQRCTTLFRDALLGASPR